MIGIVVPAHNEEAHIEACLQSIFEAGRCARLEGEAVRVWVVADHCTDATAARARRSGATVVRVEARNVGMARAEGARRAMKAGARWLAFTDADSVVDPDWLSQQLGLDSDAVCGTITVLDWSGHSAAVRQQHLDTYRNVEGHRHIHGANFGVSTSAYMGAGGFAPLASQEDVALVAALQAAGSRIAWSAAPRVRTSARLDFKAPGGFGAALLRESRRSVDEQATAA